MKYPLTKRAPETYSIDDRVNNVFDGPLADVFMCGVVCGVFWCAYTPLIAPIRLVPFMIPVLHSLPALAEHITSKRTQGARASNSSTRKLKIFPKYSNTFWGLSVTTKQAKTDQLTGQNGPNQAEVVQSRPTWSKIHRNGPKQARGPTPTFVAPTSACPNRSKSSQIAPNRPK